MARLPSQARAGSLDAPGAVGHRRASVGPPAPAAPASGLANVIAQSPLVRDLIRRVGEGGAFLCSGTCPAAWPLLAAVLHRHFPTRPIVLVASSVKGQESMQQDLETWLDLAGHPPPQPAAPLYFPAWEVLPHETRLPHADVISERLATLLSLQATRTPGSMAPMIVTSVTALMQRTIPPGEVAARSRSLGRGQSLDPLELVDWLETQGYEPEAQVTQKGEIASRGGILDVYPLTSPWPVRLEFFGNELESIRFFDPATQVSREETAAVTLGPAGELGILRQARESGQSLAAGLLDHLPPGAAVLLAEPDDLDEQARHYSAQLTAGEPLITPWESVLDQLQTRVQAVVSLSEFTPSASGPVLDPIQEPDPSLPGPPPAPAAEEPVASLDLDFRSLEPYRPLAERLPDAAVADAQRREFFAQLHRWLRQGMALHVFCNNEGERQRFLEIWRDCGLDPTPAQGTNPLPLPHPELHLGALSRGFLCPAARRVVVTDAEVFGRYKVQRPRRLKSPHAVAARSALEVDFTELEEGDYVVHVQHGIGRYLGLKVLPLGTGRRVASDGRASPDPAPGEECLVIEYAPSEAGQTAPKLYVPVTEAHLVSKYVGAGKARPPLHTLGGTRWHKAKAQAERAVRDLAGELLAIQAARDSQPGHAAAADTPWQREFEGSFLYEETPDQLRAIEATKRDMETPRPMDRLICGDVGFGKTEVAIRAAFKAVMDGRQVAVLVPTTVLAQQHFNTFRERMADYPVRVELLSRFRSRRDQQRVLRELAAGTVDIVIGTHRLVQPDVAFKELGLVVVDEEQRFGVLQKEKFKRLRRLVDVLTLSATPIPRTLYLALTGARDMSTIETPPHDRLPIETIVTRYDERVIRDAILRELNRGGQVYFLHNRVSTILTVAERLRALVPQARLAVGHGQMHSDELEEVMTTFVNGDADVLLCTTIIESGLDIPNANTILIDRADRFGLSDLYQLRGRVGRYKHQAYAYLLLPRHAGLLSDARKRIGAIRQYSTLGSGFKVAMRDLEIRGAGNMLGSEQSGHITAVGFELYCQLLKQSVQALKGQPVKPRIEVQVRLDFLALNPAEEVQPPTPNAHSPDASWGPTEGLPSALTAPRAPAFIPYAYVPEARQRIDLYRKLAQATDRAGIDAIRAEARDRFGPIPTALERLLTVTELRILAADRQVTTLETRGDRLMLTRHGDFLQVGGRFPRLTRTDPKGRLTEIRKLLLAI